eukprot:comp21838_c0_seq1/m.49317 comp21838_c0_seq1/g.49317  ORF comp21838_c0_seq1/g.49317 comp21838_c0_seq1/m.49317 type:complete len:630 (-) comp21838_c0_seq1:9-1898(-)
MSELGSEMPSLPLRGSQSSLQPPGSRDSLSLKPRLTNVSVYDDLPMQPFEGAPRKFQLLEETAPAAAQGAQDAHSTPGENGGTEDRPKRQSTTELSPEYLSGERPTIRHLEVPQFNVAMFFKQVFYHMCCPLSTPLLFLWEGKYMAFNMAFWIDSWKSFRLLYYNYFQHLILFMIVGTYIMRVNTDPPEKRTRLYLMEIVGMMTCHIFRHFMIGIKYAYHVSDPWWHQKLYHTKMSFEDQATILLFTWLQPKKETIERELEIAMERVGVNLKTVFFKYSQACGNSILSAHPLQRPKLKCRTPARDSTNGDPTEFLSADSAYDFALTTIIKSAELPNPKYLVLVTALVFALIPTIYRFSRGIFILDVMDTICVLGIVFNTFGLFWVLVTFMVTCYADYRRRTMCMIALTLCISDNLRDHSAILLQKEHTLSTTEKFLRNLDLPVLDLTYPSNMATWLRLHETFQVFAFEYKKRIEVYTTLSALGIATVLLVIVGQLLLGTKLEVVSILISLYFTFALGAYLLLMAASGVEANNQCNVHEKTLTLMKGRIAQAMSIYEIPPVLYRRLQHSCLMLDIAREQVLIEDKINPVKIIGFRASATSFRGLAGVLLSFGAFVLQLILAELNQITIDD